MDQQDSARGTGDATTVQRKGDRELVVTRTFDAPPGTVYRAWAEADLFKRWWMPRSISGATLVACDIDMQTGGKYRLEFGTGSPETMAFYGRYLEVIPNERIVWTNDEGDEGAVTTVTFEERDGRTLLTFHEVYPTKEALEEALQGSAAALPEQMEQLDQLLSPADA